MKTSFYGGSRIAPALMARARPYLDRVLDEGWFVNGSVIGELEARVAERVGVGHAVAVGSGTDALILALDAMGVGPGDEVIVPAYTFIASASSVALAGATPVFADVDPATRNIDPRDLERRITGSTAAIMPVHMLWEMAPMDEIMAIADAHGIPVLEDSAEAIGMSLHGRPAGSWGVAGVLSFFPSKTLGARGDGGMAVTDDEALADHVRLRRNHGDRGSVPYLWEAVGVNSRLDSLQAAIVLGALDALDAEIEERRELADRYDTHLAGVPGVRTPASVVGQGVPYVYLIESERRDSIARHLADHGVETECYYPRPLHLQPAFADLGYRPGDLPAAEALCARALALPLYPGLRPDEIERICALVADAPAQVGEP